MCKLQQTVFELCVLLFVLIDKSRAASLSHFDTPNDDNVSSDTGITGTTNAGVRALQLPNGFNPQPPPLKPLLYPFATESPPSFANTPGWKPIFQPVSTSSPTQSDSFHRNAAVASETQFVPAEGPIRESVVYGNWKPEPPVQPQQVHSVTQSAEILQRQHETFLPSDVYESSSPAIESFTHNYNERNYELSTRQEFNDNIGRQKYIRPLEQENNDEYSQNSDRQNQFEVTRVNVSDPVLLAMAKQLNDSIEYGLNPLKMKNAAVVPPTWPQMATNIDPQFDQPAPTSKMWPKDFMTSNEHMVPLTEDSNDPMRPSNEYDQVLSTMPTEVPGNITKMGVPYEQQNSAEEPTICVPITVSEQTVANSDAQTQVVDVERVYCFPLPATEVEMEGDNMTTTNATAVAAATTTTTAMPITHSTPIIADIKSNNWNDFIATPTSVAATVGIQVHSADESTTAAATGSIYQRNVFSKSSIAMIISSLILHLGVILLNR